MLLTQARTTFTVLLLAVFLLVRFGREFFRIGSGDLARCALAGTLGVAGSNFFYYYAIQKSTVAIAITLQYTAPIWVLLYMVLRQRESASLRRFASVLLALVGIALTIGLFQSDIKLSRVGAVAGLLASFSFALYNIVAPGLVQRHHPLQVMMYTLLGAALLWMALNPPWRLPAERYTSSQWGFLFVFACLSMLLPYVFYFTGLKYLDPTRAVVASCLEPVFGILFAAVFLHEGVGHLQILGIATVLAATVMAQLAPRAARPRSNEKAASLPPGPPDLHV
jgi:drug/metabolite transporter (DMT)-like permease